MRTLRAALYPLRLLSPLFDYLPYLRLQVLLHGLLAAGFGFRLGRRWTGRTGAGRSSGPSARSEFSASRAC